MESMFEKAEVLVVEGMVDCAPGNTGRKRFGDPVLNQKN